MAITDVDPDHAEFYGDDRQGGEPQDARLTLDMVLGWNGNLAELIDAQRLAEIGAQVVREYELDKASRAEWLETAKDALKAAAQHKPPKKSYPHENAANVKYPLLTVACMQFAARAYPAIVRGDEVIDAKVNGRDDDGAKAARAQRSANYANDQIMYQCSEWEPGTDALLHALPAIGAGFRKVYWDAKLKRPRLDFVSAIDVVIPYDAQSLELSPRISHELKKYPFEIEKLTRGQNPEWLACDYVADPSDSQKQQDFIEQVTYLDLDDDDLSEPYIVTVHKDTQTVVRIDPAFDVEDVKLEVGPDGAPGDGSNIVAIERTLNWIDYTFLPNPEGGAYGIGFGQLLASIGDVIDTTINELLDAGHLANTNTGFLSAQAKVRGGQMEMKLNAFKQIPGAQNIKDAIYKLEFPGPNATLFQLLEFLIETAKDITSVKDVLTGDAPGTQPATSTLALIEQGLQVFSAIYKRIYRSMTREFELLYKLNARYLDDDTYNTFLDAQPVEPEINEVPPAGIGHNGGPPLSPADMGNTSSLSPDVSQSVPSAPPPGSPAVPQGIPDEAGRIVPFPTGANSGLGQQAAQIQATMAPPGPELPNLSAPPPMQPPQLPGPVPGLQAALAAQLQGGAPAQRPSAAQDFSIADMDVRPVSDPTAVTEMQRLAKAQFLDQLRQTNPYINGLEATKRVLEAARLPEIEKLVIERNPLADLQQQAAAGEAQAKAEAARWAAAFEKARAEKQGGLMQAQTDLYEAQAKEAGAPQTQAAQPHEIALANSTIETNKRRLALDEQKAAQDEAERGLRLQLDKEKQDADTAHNKRLTDLKEMVSQFDAKKGELEMLKREHEHQQAKTKLDLTKEETAHAKRIAKLKEDAVKAETEAAQSKSGAEKAKADAEKARADLERVHHEKAQSVVETADKAAREHEKRMAELTAAMAQLMQALKVEAAAMNAPKRIVRDAVGKVIGVEPVKGKPTETKH